MTREEKLAQLEKILQGRTLQGSENLRAFLRFVVEKTVEEEESQLKEYVIATEVFGRGSDYNSRIDSVVRVQAGRLRAKLHEYYATEGRADEVVIDLPKGHYAPVFTYQEFGHAPGDNGRAEEPEHKANGRTDSLPESPAPSPAGAAALAESEARNRWTIALLGGLTVLSLVLGVLLWWAQTEKSRLQATIEVDPVVPAARTATLPLWGDLLRSPEPFLVVFSNTLFRGTAETGMKILKPLDAPGSTLGSAALPQQSNVVDAGGQSVTEHYTGIGEVMGTYFLGEFFARVKHPFRVKRSLLLTWEDLKSENIIVLGSPAENLFLRDLPQKQEFMFRPLKDGQGRQTFGVVNLKPQPGEEPVYLARQDGPSRSQITEDYAVISLLQGLDARNRLLILAGITTLGTQAAAEYVSKPEYIEDLIRHLNTAPPGAPPQLPASYQVLVRVKVTGGVPVQVTYVTHHVL